MSNDKQEQTPKKTARPIGDISQYKTVGGARRSDVQTSNSPDLENAKGSNVRKSKHPEWKQQTIYLPPAVAKWLKVHAAEAELEISEIVALALQEYRERHKP